MTSIGKTCLGNFTATRFSEPNFAKSSEASSNSSARLARAGCLPRMTMPRCVNFGFRFVFPPMT